ncbi:unnamed protein product, partial [Cercopithifilaria johnstoni]
VTSFPPQYVLVVRIIQKKKTILQNKLRRLRRMLQNIATYIKNIAFGMVWKLLMQKLKSAACNAERLCINMMSTSLTIGILKSAE